MSKKIFNVYKINFFKNNILVLLQLLVYTFFSLIAYCNEVAKENTNDSLSVLEWVGIIFMLIGVIRTFSGYGNIFKPRDNRFGSGYKDNEEPKLGKGCLQIITGPIIILIGWYFFAGYPL